MFKSLVSGLYHQFMAARLRAELPVTDEKLVERIVQRNANNQPTPHRLRQQVRHPFRLRELAQDWRLEVPHVGAL